MAENEMSPFVELEGNVEADPTIQLVGQVDMGGGSSEKNAEAWAVGERGGVPVSSTDQTYHNNSKYYRQLAQGDANAAAASVTQAQAAATQAAGAVTAAEAAQAAAEAAAQEAIDTVVAAQGPGIVYMDENGFYILEEDE